MNPLWFSILLTIWFVIIIAFAVGWFYWNQANRKLVDRMSRPTPTEQAKQMMEAARMRPRPKAVRHQRPYNSDDQSGF